MKIGLLIIGSEVLDGKISDLNTKILANFLKLHHLEVSEARIARDEANSISTHFKGLLGNNDMVITTGGLGPTKDDITKATLAECLNRKIQFSSEAQKVAEENYKRFNRSFPGKESGYCYLPEGFVPLPNNSGLAPSFYVEHEGKIIVSAPGVPREFTSLLQDHFITIAGKKLPKDQFFHNFIARTKRVPEEKIFGEVDPKLWDKLEEYGDVSSLPNIMGVDIGVKIRATSQDELTQKIETVKNILQSSPVHQHVWSLEPVSIEEKIVKLANQKGIKFGFSESATGGLCSSRITNISGSSQSFMGGVVCYDEKIKENILGVKRETLDIHTAVSPECAHEMAAGLKEKFNLDIAISITGYAGPGGGTEKYPVGTVCIGRAIFDRTTAEVFQFKGDRELLKERFSQAALYALLEEVEKFART
jgi:nicotinamide-nucleotide amidase